MFDRLQRRNNSHSDTVKVVVSKKWHEMDTLQLHTINSNGLSIRAISDDLG